MAHCLNHTVKSQWHRGGNKMREECVCSSERFDNRSIATHPEETKR